MRSRILSSALALMMVAAFAFEVAAQGQGAPPAGAPGAQAPGQGRPGGGGGRGRGFSLPPLLMETDAFPDGGIVPPKFVSAGGNPSVLPAFKISNAPAGTVAYAVIFHDMDVSLNSGTGDVLHMMAWNIPASANGWPEGNLPAGSVMGNNMRNQAGYMGPGAPAGPRYHHYVWELYALNANLDIPQTATRDQLLAALQGKVVAKAAYVGRFKDDPPAGGAAGGGRGQ
jgi:Raf kinase inhibitor-like YbhB/YbcL family protein